MYQRKINELLDFMYCVQEKKYINKKKISMSVIANIYLA